MRGLGSAFLFAAVCFIVLGLIQNTSPGYGGWKAARAAEALQIQRMFFSLSGVCFLLGAFLAALGTFQANIIKETQAILAELKRGQGAPKDSQKISDNRNENIPSS